MKNNQVCLTPKDLIVALELALSDSVTHHTHQSLATILGLSVSQIHGAVMNLLASGILNGKGLKGKINRSALTEFAVHGARYAFPPVLGKPCRGIRTGASSPLFDPEFLAQETDLPMVWPSPGGDSRGISLAPLHPCVVTAVIQDPSLHKVLVYLDALRAGKARERSKAEAFLQERLAWLS